MSVPAFGSPAVCRACLYVPDIDSQIGFMHTLVALEDIYGITVSEADGEVCLKADRNKGANAECLTEQATKLETGEISKEQYEQWRYNYPK